MGFLLPLRQSLLPAHRAYVTTGQCVLPYTCVAASVCSSHKICRVGRVRRVPILQHAQVCCPRGGSRSPPSDGFNIHDTGFAAQLPDIVLGERGYGQNLHPLPLDDERQRIVWIQAQTVYYKSVESFGVVWMRCIAHRG